MKASELASLTGGRWSGLEKDVELKGASCDSREIIEGQCFVAIQAERDGHDYVEKAMACGAAAAIVSFAVGSGPCLIVDDPLLALQAWAKEYRKKLQAPVIGVVGSVGKTTAKEVLATLLSKDLSVVKSPRSFNNHLGVPMTLLMADEKTDVIVLEMGANGPGDLDLLGGIAKPDHLMVTTIAAAHLEGFKDIHGVRAAKAEILLHLKKDALMMWPLDAALQKAWKWPGKSLTYGPEAPADFYPEANEVKFPKTCFTIDGQALEVPMPALYLADLVLGCFKLLKEIGLSVELHNIKNFQAAEGRLRVSQQSGFTLINDAYNANPLSVAHGIDILSQAKGRRLMVFADMLEMGRDSSIWHRQLGREAVGKVDLLLTLGSEALKACDDFEGPSKSFDNSESCLDFLLSEIRPGDTLLLKGSQAMGLEKLAEELILLRASA
jgi:UDP-N-acetylmuramoyl-tripeptide--D-alanyl-D-alanine ligase